MFCSHCYQVWERFTPETSRYKIIRTASHLPPKRINGEGELEGLEIQNPAEFSLLSGNRKWKKQVVYDLIQRSNLSIEFLETSKTVTTCKIC